MYKIILLPNFDKEITKLCKKYRSLKSEVINNLKNFDKRLHQNLGNNTYKLRITCKELNKGKNKSFRLIVLIIDAGNFLIPITIYFKGDKTNITQSQLNKCLARTNQEFNRLTAQ